MITTNDALPDGQRMDFEGMVQLLEILRQVKDMISDMTHKTAPNNNFYGNITNLNLYQAPGHCFKPSSYTSDIKKNDGPMIPTKEEMMMAVKETVTQGMWWSNRSWSVVYRVYQIKGYMGGFSQFIAEAKSWQIDTGFELNYDAVQKPITSGKLIGSVDEWEANGASKQAVVLAYAIIAELEKLKTKNCPLLE